MKKPITSEGVRRGKDQRACRGRGGEEKGRDENQGRQGEGRKEDAALHMNKSDGNVRLQDSERLGHKEEKRDKDSTVEMIFFPHMLILKTLSV